MQTVLDVLTCSQQPGEVISPMRDLLFFQLPLASSFWASTLRPATCLQCMRGTGLDFNLHSLGQCYLLAQQSIQHSITQYEIPDRKKPKHFFVALTGICFELSLKSGRVYLG
jgi:hypothetical protein